MITRKIMYSRCKRKEIFASTNMIKKEVRRTSLSVETNRPQALKKHSLVSKNYPIFVSISYIFMQPSKFNPLAG